MWILIVFVLLPIFGILAANYLFKRTYKDKHSPRKKKGLPYQYLLVDNDNTLMDFEAAESKALAQTLTEAGLPADDDTCAAYRRINDALWKALEKGETTQAELKVERFRRLLNHINRSDIWPERIADAYAKNLGNYADLLYGADDFIQSLHGKMKIALVSNGVSSIQRSRLSKCALTPLFDAIVISEEAGVAKPDPRMLEIALEQLGCTNKKQAVLMGDSLSADIAAANAAGIHSIYFCRRGGMQKNDATYTVTSHREALKLLLNADSQH